MKIIEDFAPIRLELETRLEWCYLFTELATVEREAKNPTFFSKHAEYCRTLMNAMELTPWCYNNSIVIATNELELESFIAFVKYCYDVMNREEPSYKFFCDLYTSKQLVKVM